MKLLGNGFGEREKIQRPQGELLNPNGLDYQCQHDGYPDCEQINVEKCRQTETN
jgi:hypothetical protein